MSSGPRIGSLFSGYGGLDLGVRSVLGGTVKSCVICGGTFTPHKTKRARAQTCGPACKSALLSLRRRERAA